MYETHRGDAPTVYSNEWTHTMGYAPTVVLIEWAHGWGGRTHIVTQRTDTHIFTGGGRTHNVTQRTDTQKCTN